MEKPRNKDYIFGIHSVSESLKSGKAIDKILVSTSSKGFDDLIRTARSAGVNISYVPEQKLNSITGKNHQGVIAYVSPVQFANLHHIVTGLYDDGKLPFVVMLDQVTDVRNVGAVIRTCECVGVHALVMGVKGSASISTDMMKTSSGALNYVPVCKEENLGKTIKYLKDSGLTIVACTEKAVNTIYETNFSGPIALIFGSEEHGISDTLLKKADYLSKIPLKGKIESLNISVAAGVVMYEVLRQRMM